MNTRNKKRKLLRILTPYLFLLPNTLIFFIFIVIPAFFGLYYSFTNYDGLGEHKWIGLKNYIKIFGDAEFWNTMLKTGGYALIVVPLIYILALAIAILLIRKIKARGFFRAAIYWPTMISFIVAGITWKWIFGDTAGIVNFILESMGKSAIPWTSDSFYANGIVIIATLWSRVGFFMIIFIAGLQSIPDQYYEAAGIDGARKPEIFWNVTLPLLQPTSVLVVMLSFIDSFKAYPLIYSLTGGGPGKATTFLVQYIYKYGFEKNKLGYASAMSVLLFFIIAVATAIQFKVNRGEELS